MSKPKLRKIKKDVISNGGDLPTNKKRLRNYISKCGACGSTRYDSELI